MHTYFYRGGRRVPLTPKLDTWVVRGSVDSLRKALGNLPKVSQADLTIVAEHGAVAVFSGNIAEEVTSRIVEEFLDLARRPAYQLHVNNPDDLWAETGEIHIRFKPEVTPEYVKGVFTRYSLKVLEDQEGIYLVECHWSSNTLEISSMLTENEHVLWADPNFIRHLSLRSRGIGPRN